MSLYMLSYDLTARTPEQHNTVRKSIENMLNRMGSWYKCLNTTYIVNTGLSIVEMEKSLTLCLIDDRDRMIISQTKHPLGGILPEQEWHSINNL